MLMDVPLAVVILMELSECEGSRRGDQESNRLDWPVIMWEQCAQLASFVQDEEVHWVHGCVDLLHCSRSGTWKDRSIKTKQDIDRRLLKLAGGN